MFRNYLRISYRNLLQHKFYTAINILGLSLGIAAGLVLFKFISYHLSYDRYHKKADQLYRIVLDLHLPDGTTVYEQGSPLPVAASLQRSLPQVKDQAVLLKVRTATIGVQQQRDWQFFKENNNIAFTDGHWFELFDYRWEEGNPQTALAQPNTAVISRQLAEKYFGKEEALNKTIRVDDQHLFTITGILDVPANTDIHTDIFLSRASFNIFYPGQEDEMNSKWGFISSTTQSFVWLPDTSAIKPAEAMMTRLRDQHFDASVASAYQFRLQPLKDIHFDGRYSGVMQRAMLITLVIVGLFLVLIACFNFINLATAQSAKRAREVGTRKVLGSTSIAIFWQFMIETACIVIIATIISFALIAWAIPVLNSWLQTEVSFNPLWDRSLFICLVSLLILVTALAGFYPAFVLSRWKPVDALKKQILNGHSTLFRKSLIVVQNVVVQALIICTILITLQIRHMKNADPGFNKNEVLMVPVPDTSAGKMAYLKQQLQQDPAINTVSFCFQPPLSDYNIGGSVDFDARPWENFSASTILGDSSYLRTFQIPLLAGRNLQESDTTSEFLINETFVHDLGFKDPQQVVGHHLIAGQLSDRPGTIVGVVQDFNVHPLYKEMQPTLITTQRSRYQYAAIRLKNGQQTDNRQAIEKKWQAIYPDHVYEYHYLNAQIDEYYHKEDLLNKLINVTAVIAILISCLGLLGLISFFAVQRTKEIGIRKVLGANAPDIVFILSKDFLKLIVLSILIATPIAWYCMHQWLQGFAYRITISGWVFVLTAALSILIALITVSYQAIRAAVVNPVKSLRAE